MSERRESWERRGDIPMAVAALLFIGAYAWPILDPGLGSSLRTACRVTVLVTWLMFGADYAIRFWLAGYKARFVRTHVIELVAVILPILRPLALIRLIRVLDVLSQTGGSMRSRLAIYVGGATTLVIGIASLAVLDAERGNADANITSIGDALWWSVTTVTTVGYGDQFPVTTAGRLIAVGLMITGIALLGVITATIASWLVERVQDIEDEAQAATHRDIIDLADELALVREELQRLRHANAATDSDASERPPDERP